MMVWFLVDDNLAFHRKAIEAGNAAMGLWARAGSWSAGNGTDGYVPSNVARDIGNQYQIVKLLNAGLWSRVTGGYQFHDWNHWQPDAELVKQRREAARLRKQKQRSHQNESRVTSRVTLARDPEPSPCSWDLVPNVPKANATAPPQSRPAAPRLERKPRTDPFEEMADQQKPDPNLLIAHCPLCDDNGYRGSIVCDHTDREQTRKTGMAAIQEVFNEAKARKANSVDTKSS